MGEPAEQPWVGIDVAKAELVVAIGATGEVFAVPNDADGWTALGARFAIVRPAGVVLEATGPYHRGVTLALAAAGWSPTVLNPAQSHAFRLSEGKRAKTDRADARLLARFGAQKQPTPSPILPEAVRELQDLVACRQELTKVLTMERNRWQVATPATAPLHAAVIATVQTQRHQLEAQIAALVARTPELAERSRLLQSVPGSGLVLSAVLLAELPELGQLPAKPLAALAGVAPHPHDSGTHRGARPIRGGRPAVCKALYQVAFTAVRCDPVLGAHYTQLRQRCPHKVAVIACARRLLGILAAMLRDGLLWQDTKVAQGHFLTQTP